MLKFAIIGFGGLGKLHFNNTVELTKNRQDIQLTAICDVDENSFNAVAQTNLGDKSASVDLSAYRLYKEVDELLEKEQLDFVITALPTNIHAQIAIKALDKGLHVFSEKPMALTLDQCQAMIDKANEKGKQLMIGQCLRFWPAYVKLKEYVDSKVYGKVIRGEFARLSATPKWSWQNWMMDFEKSGGAALDMHVHDVDFIQWVFGMPKTISSVATHVVSKFDSIATTYQYENMFIQSICDWGMSSAFPFSPSFSVRFEEAVVTMDASGMKIYHDDKSVEDVALDDKSAYVSEIEEFINCIKSNKRSTVSSPESVMNSVKMALCEIESASKGAPVHVQ